MVDVRHQPSPFQSDRTISLLHEPPGNLPARSIMHAKKQLHRLEVFIKEQHRPQRVIPLRPPDLDRQDLQVHRRRSIHKQSLRHPRRQRMRVRGIEAGDS